MAYFRDSARDVSRLPKLSGKIPRWHVGLVWPVWIFVGRQPERVVLASCDCRSTFQVVSGAVQCLGESDAWMVTLSEANVWSRRVEK